MLTKSLPLLVPFQRYPGKFHTPLPTVTAFKIQDSTQGSIMLESRNTLHTQRVPCDKTQLSSRLTQWGHLRYMIANLGCWPD